LKSGTDISDRRKISPADRLVGVVELPADKSIAHRSALFAAIAEGDSHIVGFPDSADPRSTLSCLRQLGVSMEETSDSLVIHGRGLDGLKQSEGDIYCGNSGTTMRLLTGILAGRSFDSTLTGDASLSKRPMGRIIDPLDQMGVQIDSHEGRPPLTIRAAASALKAITYELPVASAQVKSCVLLAGLSADGPTTVIEPQSTRDHTERMIGLAAMSMGSERHISVEGGMTMKSRLWSIPADFSAAAFFLVAGSILPESLIGLPRVGLNPTRTGLLDVLRAMGADITIDNEREIAGEPIGDLVVKHSPLTGVRIDGAIISNLIDEIPILCVAALAAEGVTSIRDAGELRHKESDRIDAMVKGLRALGASVEEFDDGLEIEGGVQLRGATVSAFHDHRIAMSMAVAGLMGSEPTTIEGASIADVSFPGFYSAIDALR